MVYILLVLVLRVFAIPVILLLMAWNRKRQPDVPEEGYCLQRTRYRLANLGSAALFKEADSTRPQSNCWTP